MPNEIFASHRFTCKHICVIAILICGAVALLTSSTTINAQSDATTTPIEPTSVPLEPTLTAIPAEPTGVPIESTLTAIPVEPTGEATVTAAPLEPTSVPLEPTLTAIPAEPTVTPSGEPLILPDTQITSLETSDTMLLTTASPSTALQDFVIYGTNGVMLQKSDVVDSGYVGTNNHATFGDLMTVAAQSSVFAPNLEIRGSTTIQTAYFNSLNNSRRVINQGQFPTTPLLSLPPTPVLAIGLENILVSPSETQTLDAGSYNTLVINSGSTLLLTGGLYTFSDVTLLRDAQLRFSAPTEIRIANHFYADSRSIIAPQDGTGVLASQILIGVYGTNATESETPAVAELAGNHLITANFYVPNGKLDIGGRSQLQGAFIANWIYVGVETRISLASFHANPIDFSLPDLPPVDSDGDGIPDSEDICPYDAYHDTVGDPCNHDEDGDGIPDDSDPYPIGNDPTPTALPVNNLVYYVSRNGNNADGRSWSTAWNELSQIDWLHIQPGSIIYLDGGQQQMLYQTELQIGNSGLPEQPITIQRSTEPGHSGEVVFFGGRSQYLPYCGQLDYNDSGSQNYREYGIHTNNHRYIVIDGMTWRGIDIHGFRNTGIRIERYSHDITIRNVEVRNNGRAVQETDGWSSAGPGVRLGGGNVTFQRVIIHDNGADSIQSLHDQNNISNFHLEQSWLYNGRQHPTVNEAANYCTHTDGIQIYDGGHISGITILESVIGPGFTQGVLFGQSLLSSGAWAEVDNVLMRDVLFTKAADNNIMGYRNTESDNWVLERVTAHCPNTKVHCLRISNSDHSVTDSIIVGGLITFDDGLDSYSGNCQWETEGFELGITVDPGFTQVNDSNPFSNDAYSISTDSPCIGSRITSVYQLLNMP